MRELGARDSLLKAMPDCRRLASLATFSASASPFGPNGGCQRRTPEHRTHEPLRRLDRSTFGAMRLVYGTSPFTTSAMC